MDSHDFTSWNWAEKVVNGLTPNSVPDSRLYHDDLLFCKMRAKKSPCLMGLSITQKSGRHINTTDVLQTERKKHFHFFLEKHLISDKKNQNQQQYEMRLICMMYLNNILVQGQILKVTHIELRFHCCPEERAT